MADKRIQDLPSASSVQLNDLLVLEQNGAAMNISGQTLVNDLATALDGHGGIANVTYTPPAAQSLNGTLTLTMADGTTYDSSITNGNGIASIAIAYSTSNQGTTPGYVTTWYSSPVAPTDTNPYQWTRIRMTDKTGTVTDAYTVSMKAINPTISIGSVTADSGADADATVTNSGTAYNPVLDFDFTLPQGEKGDTGDYIEPVIAYGTSSSSTSEPSNWTPYPSALDYTVAGSFIWKRTRYVLHDSQTEPVAEKKEIIGYIGLNGSGSGTVTQIIFNGDTYEPPAGGSIITMNIDADGVGAIANPASKSQNQVLTYDGTNWVAANQATGNINTVNSKGVDAGTTNVTLYASDIKMSSSDNTTILNAIPVASSTAPANLGTAAVGTGTTWARSDHVHNMPTAAQVGALTPDDVQYTILNSVEELGLTSGSATVAGAYSAMTDYCVLICPAEEFASTEVPSGFVGTVEIVRSESSYRGWINAHGDADSGDYRMFIDSGVPTETWERLATAVNDLTSSVSTAGGLSTNDIQLFQYGQMAFFKFRIKATSNFPVSFTKTHTLPVYPAVNYQNVVPKTNATGGVMVEVRTNGEVYVYSYSSAYNDWVTGEIWFPVAN